MRVVVLLLALISYAWAQPKLDALVNAASFAPAGLPGAEVAPGSLVVLFGTQLGPAQIVHAATLPLPQTLAGTTLILDDGRETQAALLYVSDTQMAAVLPSSTVPGSVRVQVRRGGEASNWISVPVASASVGFFARNQAGTEQLAATSQDRVNAAETPAVPGQILTLWATGLGAAPQDSQPRAQALDTPLELWVGGKPASIEYQGRSGCCIGLDQINLRLPLGITGCSVPVLARVGTRVSNAGTLAITADGAPCRSTYGVAGTGYLLLEDNDGAQSAGARFFTGDGETPPIERGMPADSCYLWRFRSGALIMPESLEEARFLRAGSLQLLSSARGAQPFTRHDELYVATLSADTPYLANGEYSLEWSGDAGIAAGSVTLRLRDLPAPDLATLSALTKSTRITWSPQPNADVFLQGSALLPAGDASVGVAFTCRVPASAGSFRIPDYVLDALPATGTSGIGTLVFGALHQAADAPGPAPGLTRFQADFVKRSTKKLRIH